MELQQEVNPYKQAEPKTYSLHVAEITTSISFSLKNQVAAFCQTQKELTLFKKAHYSIGHGHH
jgi:hypothetical protein